MKKLCLIILILILLPCSIIFCSCDEKEERLAVNLFNEHYGLVEKTTNLQKGTLSTNEINSSQNISCLNFVISTNITSHIENLTNGYKYSPISNYYIPLLKNAMAPAYLYQKVICQNNLRGKQKRTLFKNMDIVNENYKKTSELLAYIDNYTISSTEDEDLKKLYYSFEQTIVSAINLSREICYTYYDVIGYDINPNFQLQAVLDLSEFAKSARERLTFYKLIALDVYMHSYVLQNNIPDIIIHNEAIENYEPYSQLSTPSLSESTTSSLESSRTDLEKLSISLYKTHKPLVIEYNNYLIARTELNNEVNSQSKNKGYELYVDNFKTEGGVLYDATSIITKIIDICY